MKIIFTHPESENLAQNISYFLECPIGKSIWRKFPDGETYLKIDPSDVEGKDVTLVASLDHPDDKLMGLLCFAAVAREYGVKTIGLAAPYLGYMRQDKRFQEGEAISSKIFAALLSRHFDWLITIDPHLHRYKSLDEIYALKAKVLHVTDPIALWIKENVGAPILIGPDMESVQWVEAIASKINSPYVILRKERHSDRSVSVSIPSFDHGHTPVVMDDIISTGRTMIETVKQMKDLHPVCIGIHGIFAGNAYEELNAAGAAQIITCNTLAHKSNKIDVSALLADEIKKIGAP